MNPRPFARLTTLSFLCTGIRLRSFGATAGHVSTTWGYDSNTNDRRLISITNASTSSSPGPRSYTFGYGTAADGGGAQNPYTIMSSSQTSGGGGSWASQTWGYSYDSLDRLTSAVGSTAGTYSFAFDNAGNTTTYTTGAAGATSTTNPTFNNVNEMTANGSLTPAYTSDGESSSQGRSHQAYTFDAENRIVSLTIPPHFPISWTVSFQYDGLGRRIASGFAVGGSPTMTHWLWCDVGGTVGGSGLCEQRNSSDTVQKRYYAEGEYQTPTSGKLAYFPDQIGSTRDTVNVTSAAMQYAADYAPYGYQARGWQVTGTVLLHDIRFAGMFNEPASNEYLTPARLYSYNEGRFMDRDPLAEAAGPNLFAYADGNPIGNTDPAGLCAAPRSRWATALDAFWNGSNGIPGFAEMFAYNMNLLAAVASFPRSAGVAVGSTLSTVGREFLRNESGSVPPDPGQSENGINASNGTGITGFTTHGVDRAVGDNGDRAGTTPQAILDAVQNPQKVTSGVDSQGRPFQIFTGQDARVVVNPKTGKIVSVNPLSGRGAQGGQSHERRTP